jgi:hypothetical protein
VGYKNLVCYLENGCNKILIFTLINKNIFIRLINIYGVVNFKNWLHGSPFFFLEKQNNILKCDLAQGMLKPQQQEV